MVSEDQASTVSVRVETQAVKGKDIESLFAWKSIISIIDILLDHSKPECIIPIRCTNLLRYFVIAFYGQLARS